MGIGVPTAVTRALLAKFITLILQFVCRKVRVSKKGCDLF